MFSVNALGTARNRGIPLRKKKQAATPSKKSSNPRSSTRQTPSRRATARGGVAVAGHVQCADFVGRDKTTITYAYTAPDVERLIERVLAFLQAAAAFWEAGAEPQETATPWPTTTRLVPPSPTPRALLATPMGASNLDAIIDEGTLTIGWVGPALLGILIAAFGWAGRVFEWLGTLATWLFSGEWRGGGEV